MSVIESGVESKSLSMSLPKRLAVGLAISIVGVFASLVLIEILFRIFGAFSSPPRPWSDRPARYYVPESAPTLQDYPHTPEKAAGTYRIAVVGDSFSFAPYMQFDDAFPKRMERWLNLNTVQPKVEVINYGVPRYSTSHEAKITERVLREGADFVLLQITLNDPEIKPYWPTGLLLDDAGQVKLTNPIFRYWKSLAFVVTRLENNRTRREYKEYFFKLFRKKDTLENFTGSLKRIVQLCRDRNIPLVAVVFPLFGYPVDGDYPFFPIHQQVAGILDGLKVPMLDVTERYRDMPLDRMQVIPGGDRHPNEIAHRIAAEEILSWLDRQNYLPKEIIPKRTVRLRVGLDDVPKPVEGSAED